jgi:hypothetical protein
MGTIGAEIPELSRLRLLVQTSSPNLMDWEVLSSDPILAIPSAVDAGDLDKDGLLDVVGVIPLLSTLESAQYYAQVILGQEYKGSRLSGLMLLGFSSQSPLMEVADFDGDNIDDLAVVLGSSPMNQADDCQEQLSCIQACNGALECIDNCKLQYPCEDTRGDISISLDVYFMGQVQQ